MRKEKQIVKVFYDSFGWCTDAAGRYKDAVAFVDTRPVADWYRAKVHRRLLPLFGRGRYFLDAGSGPIARPEYLAYSAGYARRVCVDMSETALRDARAKMGGRGFCVVADVTQLPFRDGVFDAALSAHVLYHVPADEQAKALAELHRTLAKSGVCVIVYGQFAGLSARLGRLRRFAGRLLRRLRRGRPVSRTNEVAAPPIYAYAHDRNWFRETLPKSWDTDVRCWSVVDQEFSRSVPDNFLGRAVLALIFFLESACPHALAWVGYQTLIIRKP
jgi:SAM-dependent methyltransferase